MDFCIARILLLRLQKVFSYSVALLFVFLVLLIFPYTKIDVVVVDGVLKVVITIIFYLLVEDEVVLEDNYYPADAIGRICLCKFVRNVFTDSV